jgi:competence protein ComFC
MAVLSRALSGYVDACLSSDGMLWQDVDYLVPVPLDRRRKRERGFNQSQRLARELARTRRLKVLERCLVKTKAVPPQTTLEGPARETNVRGAYAVRGSTKVRGKVVLLVDDVFTTGSTLRECSRVLKDAGAKDVRALTLAQA